MAYEKLIKRIIWVSKCPVCDDSIEKIENPPRERLCDKCKIWVPYVQQSFVGPDFKRE